MRILVVDDEEIIRQLLKDLLEIKGHDVATARDGIEGLEKLKDVPDIVLLDIRMPHMDGLEFLERVKEISPSSDVIMVTAVADHDLALEAMKRGALDYVTKPINIKYLGDLINFRLMQRSLEKDSDG